MRAAQRKTPKFATLGQRFALQKNFVTEQSLVRIDTDFVA